MFLKPINIYIYIYIYFLKIENKINDGLFFSLD